MIDWFMQQTWMVEAIAMMVGSLILVFLICKIIDFLNGNQQ
jgi:hypothetical protein